MRVAVNIPCAVVELVPILALRKTVVGELIDKGNAGKQRLVARVALAADWIAPPVMNGVKLLPLVVESTAVNDVKAPPLISILPLTI